MLKRVISLIVGATCMVSMTGVFAGSYVSTTTTYSGTTDANGKPQIQVTTNVTLGANEVVTYLVYRETNSGGEEVTTSNLTGDDIVYVDQYKNSSSSTAEKAFSYVTLASDIGSPIKTGADVTNTLSTEVIPDFSFKVVDANNTLYWGGNSLPTAEQGLYKFETTLGVDDVVKGVKVGNTDVVNWFVSDTGAKTLWIDADEIAAAASSATITVTLDSADVSVDTKSVAYYAAENNDDSELTFENDATGTSTDDMASVIVVGNVVGNVSEFGIQLADTENGAKTTEANVSGNVARLEALGKNVAGDYAVRVYDSGNFGNVDTIYACAYYKTANGTVVVGDAKAITLSTGN